MAARDAREVTAWVDAARIVVEQHTASGETRREDRDDFTHVF